jgi:outer membrane protein assembly factor BamC
MNKWYVRSAALLTLALLSGCSGANKFLDREDSVDYKGVQGQAASPLSIPPDLTQAANDPRYRVPAGGATTYTQYTESQKQGRALPQVQSDAAVLPQQPGMSVKRDCNMRRLVVQLPPEQLFSRLVEFWTKNGFTVQMNDPAAGLIETNWAENYAKAPAKGLNKLLGGVLNQVTDSGEREKFRTRIERVAGHSEISISHQHLVQKNLGPADSSNLKWLAGPEDPELNAAMLARLMVYLGGRFDQAKAAVSQPVVQAAPQSSPAVSSPAGRFVRVEAATLILSEPFDQAWRQVGIALDTGEFTVEDRNRSAGDYFVRYDDTDTGPKQKEPGFFSQLFRNKKPTSTPQYRLHVASQGDSSQVTVFNAGGVLQTSQTAERLLNVLADKMQPSSQ